MKIYLFFVASIRRARGTRTTHTIVNYSQAFEFEEQCARLVINYKYYTAHTWLVIVAREVSDNEVASFSSSFFSYPP